MKPPHRISFLSVLTPRPYQLQWLILGLAWMIVAVLGGIWGYNSHAAIEQVERNRLATQARVIQETLRDQLVVTDHVLLTILRELPAGHGEKDWATSLTQRMKVLEEAMPGVRTLILISADGVALASNRDQLVGMDFSQREYFRQARAGKNADTLYVSPPFRTVLGIWSINLGRALIGPHGEFAGLLVATLDPEYFKTIMSSVLYADDMLSSITHGDGVQLLMVPDREGQSGKNLAQPGSFFTRFRDGGGEAKVLTGTAYATGEERMMALRRIRPPEVPMDKALVVAVGRDLGVLYRPWRRDSWLQGGALLVLILVTVAGLAFWQRQAKRSEDELTRADQALRRSNEHLHLLLSCAGEGIYGVDRAGIITFINPAALAMLGFSREEIVGHSSHRLFHHHHGDGSAFPEADCAVHQTLADGLRRKGEDAFVRKDGKLLPVHRTVTPIDENGIQIGAEVIFMDISERLAMERELTRLAVTDPLTGIANRRRFMEQVEMELARVIRSSRPAALLMLDIDHFKRVNDSHGHAAGDQVLCHFAGLVQSRLRRADVFGRLGGEEFGILLPDTDGAGAMEFSQALRRHVAQNPATHSTTHRTTRIAYTVSIGVTLFQSADKDADNVLARADAAMYRAKELGRNRVEAEALAIVPPEDR